jgi:hypothetical protein
MVNPMKKEAEYTLMTYLELVLLSSGLSMCLLSNVTTKTKTLKLGTVRCCVTLRTVLLGSSLVLWFLYCKIPYLMY